MNGNDGQGLNGLISKITSKIDTQMKNGSLNHADLLGDAQKIMGQNGGLFENLFNSMGNMGNMGNMANMAKWLINCLMLILMNLMELK